MNLKPPHLSAKPRGRLRKSSIELGVKQTARLAARRAIKDTIKTSNPLLNLILVAGLGAVASYFINKQ